MKMSLFLFSTAAKTRRHCEEALRRSNLVLGMTQIRDCFAKPRNDAP